ncbi:MAG: helix-turn-helix domain-containing protein [Armatimonadota bacterium]
MIAFCINVDLSAITTARMLLEEVSKTAPADGGVAPEDSPLIEVAEIFNPMIQDALAEVSKPPRFMDREDRLRAVRLMHERGLFLI